MGFLTTISSEKDPRNEQPDGTGVVSEEERKHE